MDLPPFQIPSTNRSTDPLSLVLIYLSSLQTRPDWKCRHCPLVWLFCHYGPLTYFSLLLCSATFFSWLPSCIHPGHTSWIFTQPVVRLFFSHHLTYKYFGSVYCNQLSGTYPKKETDWLIQLEQGHKHVWTVRGTWINGVENKNIHNLSKYLFKNALFLSLMKHY